MKIFFSGAAHEVTGSKHLLEINGKKILLDCGLFQGKRKQAYKKNRNLPFNPSDIDCVVVSHAHLDHCGNLPYLTKNGYHGNMFCTQASSDIIPIMLMDSAHIQEMDNKFVAKHVKNPIIPTVPLYTTKDIPQVVNALKGIPYHEKTEILPNIFVEFFDAGHILGSSVVKISFTEDGKEKSLVFTGDLGRKHKNLLKDPESPPTADYLITESTYGDRLHDDASTMRKKLEDIVNEAIERGGKIIIPSFSLQRTQEVIYDLNILSRDNKIPKIPIFVDSPLAIKVTEIYKKYRHTFDDKTHEDFFSRGETALDSNTITYTKTADESKKIKNFSGPAIIIAASGMCEGGRIRHHLKNEISDKKNTILFVGYQAAYTLGRKILERRPSIKIFNTFYRVKAHIKKLNGYSGHADYQEILDFIDKIKGLKTIFVVHGEPTQSYAFAKKLRQQKEKNWTVEIPEAENTLDPDEIYWDGKSK